MRTVECPVCRCTVEGSSERELSTCIEVHFCEEHGLEGRGTEREGGSDWRGAEGQTIIGGTMNESSTSYEAQGTSMERSRESSMSRGTESSASRTEEMGVECPGCRERVTGRSEEEVSTGLREHMESTHRDEPYMTQLAEKLKGRR